MTIDKQFFEDILNGKVKGKFVLRNGSSIDSNLLERSSSSSYPYTFKSMCHLYTSTGFADRLNSQNCNYDIVDFIPTVKSRAYVHQNFTQTIEECIKYADEWRNPLRNDAGGSDQFRIIYNHLVEIKQELNK